MIAETLSPSPIVLPASLESLKAEGRAALAARAAHEDERQQRDALASRAALALAIAAEVPAELLALGCSDLEDEIGTVKAATAHFVLSIHLPRHRTIYTDWLRAGPGWIRRQVNPVSLDAPGPAYWYTRPSRTLHTATLGAALALAELGADEAGPFLGEVT